MNDFTLYPYAPGDRVIMRKAHPCGSKEWEVQKAVSDVSLVCCKCGHRMRMKRRDLEKATREVIPAGQKGQDKSL